MTRRNKESISLIALSLGGIIAGLGLAMAVYTPHIVAGLSLFGCGWFMVTLVFKVCVKLVRRWLFIVKYGPKRIKASLFQYFGGW